MREQPTLRRDSDPESRYGKYLCFGSGKNSLFRLVADAQLSGRWPTTIVQLGKSRRRHCGSGRADPVQREAGNLGARLAVSQGVRSNCILRRCSDALRLCKFPRRRKDQSLVFPVCPFEPRKPHLFLQPCICNRGGIPFSTCLVPARLPLERFAL